MSQTIIDNQRAKAVLVSQAVADADACASFIRWGSWTVAAELAEKVANAARGIRALELMPEGLGQQDMMDLLVPPPVEAVLLNFGPEVGDTSSANLRPQTVNPGAGVK